MERQVELQITGGLPNIHIINKKCCVLSKFGNRSLPYSRAVSIC